MAWIELHQSLPTHKKTLKLKKLLGIDTAATVGHLCCLWLWALDNTPDGYINDIDDDDLCDIMLYHRATADIKKALREAGFLDDDGCLHDWSEYAGKLIERRNADAERKRLARTQKAQTNKTAVSETQKASCGCPQDVRRTSESNPEDIRGMSCVTVPNSTVPNSIVLLDGADGSKLSPEQAASLQECEQAYTRIFKCMMTTQAAEEIITYIRAGFEPAVIIDALAETKDRNKGQAYFWGIMRNRARDGVITKAALDASRSKGKVKAQEQTDYSDPERYKNMDLCGIREARDDEFA
jgi:hypothetical protein